MILEGIGEKLLAFTAPITPRGRAIILLASLLAVLSFFQPNPVTRSALFSSSILVFSLLVVSRVVFASREAVLASLIVERRLLDPPLEKPSATVELIIRNPTPIPLDRVEVYDNPPPILTTSTAKQPVKTVFLPAYGELRLRYNIRLVVGRHSWGPLILVFSDWLGIYRGKVRVEKEFSVAVKPRPLVPRRGITPTAPFLPAGVSRTRRKGSGVEFYSLREYMPEDDVRLIDWKSYARLRKLFVKEYEQEAVFHSLVVVDVTPTLASGVIGETKVEYAARIAASLATYFARRGDYYRVAVIQPNGGLESTPWLRGRRSSSIAVGVLGRILWPLDGHSTLGATSRPLLFKHHISRLLPREKTVVVLVSDFSENLGQAEEYAEILGRLVTLRHEVMAVVPLTTLFEERALSDARSRAIYRLLAYEKLSAYRGILRALRAKGVTAAAAGPHDLASYIIAKLEAYRGVMT